MCVVNNENYTLPVFPAEISVLNSAEEKSSHFIMLKISPLCLNFVLNSSRIKSHQHGLCMVYIFFFFKSEEKQLLTLYKAITWDWEFGAISLIQTLFKEDTE